MKIINMIKKLKAYLLVYVITMLVEVLLILMLGSMSVLLKNAGYTIGGITIGIVCFFSIG